MPSSRLSLRLPSVGEQFDKYSLLAKLATGGMAELFVAELTGASGFSKKVVIKRILPHVAHDEQFTTMFLDEAKTCAQINHPNVCQVFDLCQSEGSPFLVLEHLEGATVGEIIRRGLRSEQPLDARLAAGIIVQACDGLHAAHEQVDDDGVPSNLVHRDVSPGNLFVTVDGIVKVLDFGIAKARWMSRKTKTGTLLGKCEYMSPEQARGGVVLDRRSDIFSLGILAWELVCGDRLFRRESEYESLRAVLRDPIERPLSLRPDLPHALDDAIMHALERDPDDRYRSAYEFRQALSLALRDIGGPTPMSEIAPLIRASFAQELKVQRAVLREASKLATRATAKSETLSDLQTDADGNVDGDAHHFANTNVRTNSHQRLLTLEQLAEHAEVTKQTEYAAEENFDTPITEISLITEEQPVLIPQTPSPPATSETTSDPKSDPESETTADMAMPPHHVPVPLSEAAVTALMLPQPAITAQMLPSPSPQQTSTATNTAAIHLADPPWHVRHRTILMLLLTLLLGAGVTTGSLLFFGPDGAAQDSDATEGSLENAKTLSLSTEASKRENNESKIIVASAGENAARLRVLREKNTALPATVTALPAAETTAQTEPGTGRGTLLVYSSRRAKVYLYPKKTLLGTTPLKQDLAPGRYKLKIVTGPRREDRKYFQVRIKAGGHTLRKFRRW